MVLPENRNLPPHPPPEIMSELMAAGLLKEGLYTYVGRLSSRYRKNKMVRMVVFPLAYPWTLGCRHPSAVWLFFPNPSGGQTRRITKWLF